MVRLYDGAMDKKKKTIGRIRKIVNERYWPLPTISCMKACDHNQHTQIIMKTATIDPNAFCVEYVFNWVVHSYVNKMTKNRNTGFAAKMITNCSSVNHTFQNNILVSMKLLLLLLRNGSVIGILVSMPNVRCGKQKINSLVLGSSSVPRIIVNSFEFVVNESKMKYAYKFSDWMVKNLLVRWVLPNYPLANTHRDLWRVSKLLSYQKEKRPNIKTFTIF